MQLRNGTNTISDARFETAQERLSAAHDADRWRAAEGRTEELPYQTAARHAREFSLLAQDRMYLSVQEWLKIHPDAPDLKQRGAAFWSREISAGKARLEHEPQRQEPAQKARQQQA